MTHTDIVMRLQHLGMSGYEAKAYLTLVSASVPLNGYEVAKRSGVPRSTVYETLGKLVSRGAAFEVKRQDGGDGVAYLPLPPRVLVDRLTKEYSESLSELERVLPSLTAPPEVRLIHDLNGRYALLERAEDIVSASRHELFVSAWASEWGELSPSLVKAAKRSVDVSAVHFGSITTPVGHCYEHVLSAPEIALENLGCRMFTVIGDRKEAVIGGITEDGAWGVYTDNPAVVLLGVEFIRHDIAIQLMAQQFADSGINEFWHKNADLQRLRADSGLPVQALRFPGPN